MVTAGGHVIEARCGVSFTYAMDMQQVYVSHLPLIEELAAFVCRRNHMSVAETEAFIGFVKLKLIEDDYAVIRRFDGRSLFRTYLTTIIMRLLVHQRRQATHWSN